MRILHNGMARLSADLAKENECFDSSFDLVKGIIYLQAKELQGKLKTWISGTGSVSTMISLVGTIHSMGMNEIEVVGCFRAERKGDCISIFLKEKA